MIYHKSAPEFRSCLIVSSVRWLEILQMINTYVIELYRLVRAVEFFKRIQEYCQSCVQVGDFGIPNPTCGYTPIWTLCIPTGPIFNPNGFMVFGAFLKWKYSQFSSILIILIGFSMFFSIHLGTPPFTHRIHGAGIYMLTWLGYIDGIHGTPYIAAPWILWVMLKYVQGTWYCKCF